MNRSKSTSSDAKKAKTCKARYQRAHGLMNLQNLVCIAR